MRRLVCYVAFALLATAGLGQAGGRGRSVAAELDLIGERYNIFIAYSTLTVGELGPVPSYQPTTLTADLTTVLSPHGLKYTQIGRQYVVTLAPQSLRSVVGFVEDKGTRERLVGATVYAIKGGRGVLTNGYGYFSLTDLDPSEQLVFRYLGYPADTFRVDRLRESPAMVRLTPSLELLTVEVLGRVSSVAGTSVEGESLNPGILEHTELINGRRDLNSWLSLQPGVQSATGGYRGFAFRGADPEHNLTLLDDATLYLPSHAVGFFSIVPGEAIRSWKLYRGAGPAKYGDRVGGVLDLRLREGNRLKRSSNISLGLSDIAGTTEGPVGKGSYFVSARRGLTDFWLDLLRPDNRVSRGIRPEIDFGFYDLAAKVNQPIGERQQLFASVFVGQDRYSDAATVYEGDASKIAGYTDRSTRSWGNVLGSVRHNVILGDRWFANSTLTLSDFRFSAFDLVQATVQQREQPDSITVATSQNVFDSRIRDFGLKSDLQYAISKEAIMTFGVDATVHRFNITNGAQTAASDGGDTPPSTVPTLARVNTLDLSTYLSFDYTPNDRLSTSLGFRWSSQLSGSRPYQAPLPRASATYKLREQWGLNASFVQTRQYIHQIGTNNPGLPRELWVPTIRGLKPLQSDQVALSLDYRPTPILNMSLGGYATRLQGLTRFSKDALNEEIVDWVDNVQVGRGKSRGLEFQLNLEVTKWTIDCSYTLARSTRQFDVPFFGPGPVERARLDRRHAVTILNEYRMSKRWSFSGVMRAGSGLPARRPQRTEFDGEVLETNLPLTNNWNYDGAQIQLRSSFTLDLGAKLKFPDAGRPQSLNMGVQNVTLRRNPLFINLRRVDNPDPGKSSYENTEVFTPPFIPYLRFSRTF